MFYMSNFTNVPTVVYDNHKVYDNHIPDSAYSIDKYTLFRNNRVYSRGGGVAIYCRSMFKATLVSKSVDSFVEFLNIQVCGHDFKLLVSCVYNPQRCVSCEPYFADLAPRSIDYDFLAVLGDFIINILANDVLSRDIVQSCTSIGLSLINNSLPTRFSNISPPSLLDLFLVSDVSKVVKFDQCTFISDHDLLFCCLDIPICHSDSVASFSYRDYNKIDFLCLSHELSTINWTDCFYFTTVNEKLEWLLTTCNALLDRCVPIKRVTRRSSSAPWFSSEVLQAIKVKNKLHTKWKMCPNERRWSAYVYARNYANSLIKRAKRNYFLNKLGSSLSTKQLWNNIRNLRIVGKEFNHCKLSPSTMNNFFSRSFPSMVSTDIQLPDFCCSESSFHFSVVSESELFSHVNTLRSNAVGYDGLSIKFIKIILPSILSCVTHIFNHCVTTSSFPDILKIAIITPVAKY